MQFKANYDRRGVRQWLDSFSALILSTNIRAASTVYTYYECY